MSDKVLTREQIDLLRGEFIQWALDFTTLSETKLPALAAKRYPYPKSTIPNVVTDMTGVDWWIEHNCLMRRVKGALLDSEAYTVINGSVALEAIKKVLNQPTIEIEDDGHE